MIGTSWYKREPRSTPLKGFEIKKRGRDKNSIMIFWSNMRLIIPRDRFIEYSDTIHSLLHLNRIGHLHSKVGSKEHLIIVSYKVSNLLRERGVI